MICLWRALDSGGAFHARQLMDAAKRAWNETAEPDINPNTGEIIPQEWSEQQFKDALWSLVWQGKVTNSSFAPVRALTAGAASPRKSTTSRRRGRVAPIRRATTDMTLGGLWSAVIGQAEAEDTDQTERALALVETLLDRYGVIAQPVIDKENIPGGYSALYPVLNRMEEHGRLVRGMFVRGFASATRGARTLPPTSIVEIDDRQAYVYHGNYSLYLEKRQQRLDAADAQRERDNNLYRTELEWIRRQPQARGTKARSRVESFGELEERLRKRRESGDVRLDVKAAYIGKKIFEVRGLSKRFGDKVILDGFDYRFARYEKMGIVGDNGTGKSTFIKMLMGLVQPDAGTIDIGETVRFGYYSQDGLSFDEGAKVIDVVTEIAEHIELGEGRRLSASQFLSPKLSHMLPDD